MWRSIEQSRDNKNVSKPVRVVSMEGIMFSLAFVHFLPSPFPSSPFPFPSSSNPPFPLSFLPVAFSFLIYLPIQRYGYDLEQNPSERGPEYCRKLCEM